MPTTAIPAITLGLSALGTAGTVVSQLSQAGQGGEPEKTPEQKALLSRMAGESARQQGPEQANPFQLPQQTDRLAEVRKNVAELQRIARERTQRLQGRQQGLGSPQQTNPFGGA